jgi:hypothetical protein
MSSLGSFKHACQAAASCVHWLWAGSQRRLARQLAQNLKITQDVWTTPTVAEQYGLLGSSAHYD